MGIKRRYSLLFVALCLLLSWLLYGGLELAEELQLVVKVQPSDADLDMEALAQLASALKSHVPDSTERPPVQSIIIPLILSGCVLCQQQNFNECPYPLPALQSIRLHQGVSVYRI